MPPTVDRASGTRVQRTEDEAEAPRSRAPERRDRPAPPSLARDAEVDRAVADAAKNDRILYVGMNEDSGAREAAALRATGATVSAVHASDAGVVTLGGRSFDVSDEQGVQAFTGALAAAYALGPEQTSAIGQALRSQYPSARDELAKIALAWAPGEAGGAIPSRLVLSGHHIGDSFGGASSHLATDAVRALAEAMPSAANQIEDVHFSGCFTERDVKDPALWQRAFPNLRTMWGYAGYAPLAPVTHLAAWERLTRGRAEEVRHASVAPHAGVVVWSRRGEVVGEVPSLAERREARDRADAHYADWLSGARRTGDPYDPAARGDYAAYQRIAASPDASPRERAEAAARAAVMFRVRFYEHGVREGFARTYGAEVASACSAIGVSAPDFGALGRREAAGAARAILARLGALPRPLPDPLARAARALEGLVELRSDVIDATWCH